MTLVWVAVLVVLLIGLGALSVLVRRLEAAVDQVAHVQPTLRQVRLTTILVEDELAALRATLGENRHR